jgi:hypothetical protein
MLSADIVGTLFLVFLPDTRQQGSVFLREFDWILVTEYGSED